MKIATAKDIKQELTQRSPKELLELCLRLSRFKKENKELLTYLLFEAADEAAYVESIKEEIDQQFEEITTKSYYLIKKSTRKILRNIKQHIRYSPKKETEVELLLYFCTKLKALRPSIQGNNVLQNLFDRQIDFIRKKLLLLHEDLQYDYTLELEKLLLRST
ncbi:MAG: hypothetical protein R2828_34440 [Saprospiraceae bacterium]